MYPFDTSARFTERERLVVRLMYQRPAGNRFPDDDRTTVSGLGEAAGGGETLEITICHY